MSPFRELPIRYKLASIILGTSTVALLVAGISVAVYDQVSFRHSMANDLSTLADVIGGNATAALSFRDTRAAQDVLSALRFKPNVMLACIYTSDGVPFVRYPSTGNLDECPPSLKHPRRAAERLQLAHSILLDHETIGYMYLESSLDEAAVRLRRYFTTCGLVFLIIIIITFLVGARLQRLISRPILALVDMVRDFSTRQNFAVHVPEHSRDELELLTSGFTRMLQQIQRRDQELQWHYEQLNAARQAAETAALHDPLTRLPNRRLFLDRLTVCLQRAERHPGYICALLFLDMDRFKIVNDSLGHDAGDELLIAVAERLRNCIRRVDSVGHLSSEEDVVARLGGDEFAVLLDGIRDISDAIRVANRIRESLAPPVSLRGKDVSINASVGITTSASHYRTAETMLRDADTAMYSAKASGGGSIIFDQAMHLQALERLHLESELRQALEQQEFVLYYQPIVSLPGGKIEGFESLLRWRSPYRGFIPPGDFIPLAEETGLIVPLGGWVLHEACCQVQRWRERFGQEPFLQVNVNISARQFLQPDMASLVARSLNDACLEGSCLCLELTEGVAMDDAERTSRMLEDLRRLGVRLSIDDFGTGYSSLNYLHRFPVETLKIDRSFVGNMDQDVRNQNIVRAIISLAHNLRMKVVAEGAETAEQVALLAEMKCDYVQGFYFFHPMPAADIENLLELRFSREAGRKSAAATRSPAA